MTVNFTITPEVSDFSRCKFVLSGFDRGNPSGYRVSLHALLGRRAAILESDTTHDTEYAYTLPGRDNISGVVDLSDPSNSNLALLTVYVAVEEKIQNTFTLSGIAAAGISVPKAVPSLETHKVSISPLFATRGDRVTATVEGPPKTSAYVIINDKEHLCRLDSRGIGNTTFDTASLSKPATVGQQFRVFIAPGESTQRFDTDVIFLLLPHTEAKAAIAASDANTFEKQIITTTDVARTRYPEAGVPDVVGCQSPSQLTRTSYYRPSSSSSAVASYSRVHGFSAAQVAQDLFLIALAAHDAIPTEEPENAQDLAMARSARVHLLLTSGGDYASAPRLARVTFTTAVFADCTNAFEIEVDDDIWDDNRLFYLYGLESPFKNIKFKILQRVSPDRWLIAPTDPYLDLAFSENTCFRFVPFCGSSCSQDDLSPALDTLSPLPHITVNGLAVSASNPQIATNSLIAPSTDIYAYVIAEAPVDGVMQLFFYGLDLTNTGTFGWRQITFDGENRSARTVVDKQNNLHIVWESNRCQPGQIMYGVLGPASRGAMNETLASAVDKQALLNTIFGVESVDVLKDRSSATQRLETSIITVADPVANDLRDVDIDGLKIGASMWEDVGSNVTIIDEGTITIECNPLTDESVAFATLKRDEFDNLIDSSFSQFSYQISFRLAIASTDTEYGPLADLNSSRTSIDDLFSAWKQSYTPLAGLGVNVFDGTGSNRYTIGEPTYVYDNVIPIVGSYRRESPSPQLLLRHFMLAAVPEKVRFTATNTETFEEYCARNGCADTYIITTEVGTFECVYGVQIPDGWYAAGTIENPFSSAECALEYVDGKWTIHFIVGYYEVIYSVTSTSLCPPSVGYVDKVVIEQDAALFSVEPVSDYESVVQSEQYTGKFKLAIVTETAANVSDPRLGAQRYHIVKQFGRSLEINDYHDYKIAVHYSRLREEDVLASMRYDGDALEENSLRFAGDIILSVDDEIHGAETFVPDFVDGYYQFDIGLGCAISGEYSPPNLRPYDGIRNDDLDLTLSYSQIAIGPHSTVANDYLTNFALADRNVSRMYIASAIDEYGSLTAPEETFLDDVAYLTSLGMKRGKVRLSQIPITFDGRNASPDLCLDDCGHVHLTWQSNRDGNWEIYYTSSLDSGMPFRFDTRITRSDSNSIMPSIGIDENGRRLIAWQDNRTGKYQIYAARSTAIHTCDQSRCAYRRFEDDLLDLPLNYDEEYEYFGEYSEYLGEYIGDPYVDEYGYESGSVCRLRFRYTAETSGTYHFIAQFYEDAELLSLTKQADSRYDIGNWFYRIGDGISTFTSVGMLPYGGVDLIEGEVVEVWYEVSRSDGLEQQFYYVNIIADDGDILHQLEQQQIYYCGTPQISRCWIPCTYTNSSEITQSIGFRVTVYTDDSESHVVLSADSTADTRCFRIGNGSAFTGLIDVDPSETVNISFNPQFLPHALSNTQNADSTNTLLCNTTYWVVVESIYLDDWVDVQDSFALHCICDDQDDNTWRRDLGENDWYSSGQGGVDLRVTSTDSHALFPSVAGSRDGKVYIVWEDQRHSTEDAITPSVYFAVWDAEADKLYSSAQGYWDSLIADLGYYRPKAIVTHRQHLLTAYSDGSSIRNRICSLATTRTTSSSSAGTEGVDYYFGGDSLGLTVDDVTDCVRIDVYEEDVVELYHDTGDKPVSLVDKCKIRFLITAPASAYAVRLRNASGTFSEWMTVHPQFSSSSGTSLQAYAISDRQFVVQWILSPGSGNKVVGCEIMTHAGKTRETTIDLIARYKELQYSVYFYRDLELNEPASEYNGYPVVSTRKLLVEQGKVLSLDEETTESKTIYFKVVFSDSDYVEETLALAETYGLGDTISYDVVLPGGTQRGNLEYLAPTALSFDFNAPATSSSSSIIAPGSYRGSFTIDIADGIDHIDGLAAVVVNVPSPCGLSSSSVCEANRPTIDDIKSLRRQFVATLPVELEKFYQKYDRDLLCNFMSNQCVNGTDSITDQLDDDLQEPTEVDGPVSCEEHTWSVESKGEPCFYERSTLNRKNWVVYSPIFEMDFSDTRIDYLKFTSSSVMEGIMFMLKPNQTIGVSGADASCTQNGNPTGTNSRAVSFAVPYKTVLFNNSYEQDVRFLCHKGTDCNYGSAQKTVIIEGTASTTIGIIGAGSPTNHGQDINSTGTTLAWALASASGKNESEFLSSSSTGTPASYQTSFEVSISRNELNALGFIRSNGVLQFRFAFIASGVGFLDIGFTCGASCEDV